MSDEESTSEFEARLRASERETPRRMPAEVATEDERTMRSAAKNVSLVVPTPRHEIEPRQLDPEAYGSVPDAAPSVMDVDLDEVELADEDDVDDVADDDEPPIESAPLAGPASARQQDPAPSLIGTMPAHDVAQALRAMMGEVADYAEPATPYSEPISSSAPSPPGPRIAPPSRDWMPAAAPAAGELEDGDTQTRLPENDGPLTTFDPTQLGAGASTTSAPIATVANPTARAPFTDAEPLPAFSLDEPLSERPAWWPQRPWQATPEPAPTARAVADARGGSDDEELEDSSESAAGSLRLQDTEFAGFARAVPAQSREPVSTAITRDVDAVHPAELDPNAFVETTAVFKGPLPSDARPSDRDPVTAQVEAAEGGLADPRTTHADLPPLHLPEELPASSDSLPRFSLPSIPEVIAEVPDTTYMLDAGPMSEAPATSGAFTPPEAAAAEPPLDERPSEGDVFSSVDVRLSSDSIEILEDLEPASEAPPARPPLETPPVDVEIVELLPEAIIAAPEAPAVASGSTRPRAPSFRPPAPKTGFRPAYIDDLDPEVRELAGAELFGQLIAVYRQRLGMTDGPNKQAMLLLKLASVYESGLHDPNEAYQTLMEAFELAPANEEVITAVDRVGKETQRIGELADRVKKKLLPGAPDDKRVVFLGHLVYWYERVLGRGNEVNTFVSEIERHDRVHPVVLKRAAQVAAMNDDTKTQREHLQRALERTIRREEKVALYIALAGAYGGTPEALKHYCSALELDPTSLVALQGLKRIGKEKEDYAQIQWALERQAEVAPTEAERIDALLELAEIQERKFLKRETAAELLERVLELEPAHPSAMRGLERCYHALRNWEALSRILAKRSEHTFDAKQKVELLERAAEVHEAKLGDIASALEVYKNILVVEPNHRRALGDLARLYEKLGDWANVATYKGRLAELALSKRSSSQELVKLGDFLNVPERDPELAKAQYERAVVVDPTNAAGWEALQKIASAEGDDRRVIECLEQRKKHTDVPRQRAVVLVELANVYLARGDEDAAQKCFEQAIRADSSNEAAAVAMLDAYTAEERWADAAPLCELLVNAAIRDRDGEALFVRLRLATRIAAALGDAERAVTSAVAALEARPKDAGAQADLIAVCSQSPAARERAREPITRIGEAPEEDLGADILTRLAALQQDNGDLEGAAETLLKARQLDPEGKEIKQRLATIYLAQGDFPRACKLKVDMARNATNADERFDLFVEAGEIWSRRAGELEKAASVFEEARALKPNDPWLLETLSWVYGQLGDWATYTRVLDDLAEAQDDEKQKIKTLIQMADVFRDKLGDLLRASDLYDQALDLDRKRLDIFEELVRTLTEAKNWDRLERSYRKMIARTKDQDEPDLQFLLFHQLGLIYRDRLGDASRAYDSLDAASRLRPSDSEVRKIVIELLVVTDNLDNAVARLRDEIDRAPYDTQLYAELYDIFLRQHAFDKAWCTVNVLARLREPTPEQRRFHEDYPPMPLDRVPGQIVEQAWRSHIFLPTLDPALTSLFSLMTPAVARMRFGQLRPEQRVGRPFTPTHSRMHDRIRTTFNNASEILAVPAPELLLADPKSTAGFAPALAPFGSVLVCVPQVEAQASSLVYDIGKRLAEQRAELSARAFFPGVADLTSLLGTAMRVSRNEVAKDAAAAALDASFAAILTPQERDGIRSIVLQATSDGTNLDVRRWTHAADLSSMRAGLLIAGDIEPARQSIDAETPNGSDLSPQEKLAELLKFAVSDLYSDLRGAIGVAVQG